MVKGLEGMIRLHKWQLDEKRRQLNDLEAMRDDLLRQKALLAEQLSFEQQKAAAAPVVDFAYANYATSVMQRQQKQTPPSSPGLSRRSAKQQMDWGRAKSRSSGKKGRRGWGRG